jgi:hypothetical protein
MKKFVYGMAILMALAVGAIGVSAVVHKGNALDAESRDYVDRMMPAIATSWNKNELIERATPDLLAVLKPDRLAELINNCSRLGKMIEYHGATGEAMMWYVVNSGPMVSASYVAKAKFDNGLAIFRLGLRKLDGRWLINSFYVEMAPGDRSPGGA